MITLDVENRRPVLGRLVGEQIALTPLGKAVADCWRQIPHFHPEVKLLEFTVMPDHFHGLLFVLVFFLYIHQPYGKGIQP